MFVFDRDILDALPRADRRVEFIRDSLAELSRAARRAGRSAWEPGRRLIVRHGLAGERDCRARAAAARAGGLRQPRRRARRAGARRPGARALADGGHRLHSSKDHVVFERSEVLTGAGTPYSVFTPYKNAWLKKVEPFFLKAYPVEPLRRQPGRAARRRWRRPCRRWRDTRLRAEQPADAEDPDRQQRRASAVRRLPAAHRRLRRDAQLPRREGAELPVGAPALRHRLDPPAGARGLRAHRRRAARAARRSGCRS